jgi:hypothetical protein
MIDLYKIQNGSLFVGRVSLLRNLKSEDGIQRAINAENDNAHRKQIFIEEAIKGFAESEGEANSAHVLLRFSNLLEPNPRSIGASTPMGFSETWQSMPK